MSRNRNVELFASMCSLRRQTRTMEIKYYNTGIGSKCYYRQDLYCARVRNVFTDGTSSTLGSSLLVAAFFIFLCIVPRCLLYSRSCFVSSYDSLQKYFLCIQLSVFLLEAI